MVPPDLDFAHVLKGPESVLKPAGCHFRPVTTLPASIQQVQLWLVIAPLALGTAASVCRGVRQLGQDVLPRVC
jgi:hypothetical protein